MSFDFNLKYFVMMGCIMFSISTLKAQISFLDGTRSYKKDINTRSVIPGAMADVNGDLIDDLIIIDKGKMLKIGISNGQNQALTMMQGPSVSSSEEWTLTLGDIDNDGFSDILTSGAFGFVNVCSVKDNIFSQKTFGGGFYAQGSNLVDINNDGWLDYFVCDDNGFSRIYLNNGNGGMILSNVIDFSTQPVSDGSGNYGSEWIDINNDGLPDLSIAKCRAGVEDPADPRRINVLYINNGDGTFSEKAKEYFLDTGDQSWVTTFGDIDNDGDYDVFIANHYAPHMMMENIEGTHFESLDFLNEALSSFAFQAVMRDFDNDGFLDVVIAGVEGIYFLHNNGDKTFTKIEGGAGLKSAISLSVGDIDDDGFLDLHVHNAVPINTVGYLDDALWINQGNSNHYLKVSLEGKQSNRSGIGARVEIYGAWGMQVRYVKGGESYGILNSLQQHFGLGQYNHVDSLIIKWPSGIKDVYTDIVGDQTYFAQEGLCMTPSVVLYEKTLDLFDQPLELTAPEGFLVYEWSTGQNSQNITVLNEGIYRLKLRDANDCATIFKPILVKNKCFTEQTKLLPYDEELKLCSNETFTLSAAEGLSYFWNTGEQSQNIVVSENGNYTVIAQDFCGNVLSDSIHLVFETVNFTTQGDTIKQGETAVLTSDHPDTQWFDSEQSTVPLFVGNNFTTTPLLESAVFYALVVQLLNQKEASIGENKFPTTNLYSSTGVAGNMIFNVFKDCVIHSILVETDLAGKRKINVKDKDKKILFSKIVDLTVGKNRIVLDVALPPGLDYVMETDPDYNLAQFSFRSPKLVRTFENTNYPYSLNDVISLERSGTGPTYYYYFYDWEIYYDKQFCESEIQEVKVYVDTSSATEDSKSDKYPSILPNPTFDQITIKSDEGYNFSNFSIFNLQGQIFQSGAMPVDNVLDTSYLPSGMYYLVLRSPHQNHKIKFVKI